MKKINLVRDINNQQISQSHQKIKPRRILNSSKSFYNRKQKIVNKNDNASMYGLTSKKILLTTKEKKTYMTNSVDDINEQKRKYLQCCQITDKKQNILMKLNQFKIDLNIQQIKNEKPRTQKAVRKKYQFNRIMKSCLSCENNLRITLSTPKNASVLSSQNLVKSQASSSAELRERQNIPVIFCPFFWQNQRQIKNRVDRIRNIRKINIKDIFETI